MAVEYATKANPIELSQIDPGGIISSQDVKDINKLINALAFSMPRMIAYSLHHTNPITVGTSYEEVYRFWVRLGSVEQMIFFNFWVAGVDIQIYEITPGTANSQTLLQTISTAGTGTPYTIPTTTIEPNADMTFDVNNETLLQVGFVIKMRKKNGSGGSSGLVAGFVLAEQQDTNGITGTPDYIDYWLDDPVTDPYRPIDVFRLQALFGNIENLLKRRIRGCAVVYPKKLAPILSSCYLRGDGPFQWLGAPWAKTAKVIFHAQCVEDTTITDVSDYAGRVLLSAFSDAELVSLDDQGDASEYLVNTFAGSETYTMGNPLEPIIGDVNIRSNGWNNIYVAFRGMVWDQLHNYWYNKPGCGAQWDDFIEGCIWIYANDDTIGASVNSDVDLYEETIGRNLGVMNWDQINITDPTIKVEFEDANIDDPSSTLRATAVNNDGFTSHLFDYTNNRDRHSFSTDTGTIDWNEALGAVSPAPPFVLPGNNDRPMLVSLGRHGWARLYSVWINDEYEIGDTARFAQATRPAPSLLAKDFISMLNLLANHPFGVYGIRHVPTRDPANPAAFGNGLNRIHLMSISDLYEIPDTQDAISDAGVDLFCFPFYTGRYKDNATLARHPKTATIKITYAIFQIAAGPTFIGTEATNPENAKFKLGFSARISNIPPPLSGHSLRETTSTVYVENVKEKVRSAQDANTQTLWDAFVNCNKAGRPRSSLDNTDPYYAAMNQYDWVPEILGEKYPWDSFEFDVDLSTIIGDDYASNNVFAWIAIDCEFRTYWKDGTGDNPTALAMFGTERFVLVIASAACVAKSYPLE